MSVKKDYSITEKKLWRCHVCNDLHYGKMPPFICPTCGARGGFIQIDKSETLKVIDNRGGEITSKKAVIDAWRAFSGPGRDFMLVDDEEMYNGLAIGVLENLKNYGLKYCPCRLISGDAEADLKLICPCQFEAQQVWTDKGECWCGLFIARNKNE